MQRDLTSTQHPAPSTLRALVVGMEKSGLASIRLLLSQGAQVHATDLKLLSQLPEAAAILSQLGVPFTQQSPTRDPAPSTQHPAPVPAPSTQTLRSS